MRCFECGAKNEYELRKTTRKYEGDGYNFELDVVVPYCKVCGAPLENDEIETLIAKQANEKIREQRNIIRIEEILEILDMYNISQKHLSKLLGWGEITLTRYISGGYTPNQQNSQKLKLLKDPYMMKKLISEQEEEIQGGRAYNRLLQSVNEQINRIEIKKGKIYQIVNWFLSQTEEDNYITHLALQKLLYFSQGWNYIFNQRWLFDDDCEAWVHGAVYRVIFDEFKKFKYLPLPKMDKPILISEEEIEVLEFVKKYYFNVYTAKALEKICHLEEPFRLVRKDMDREKNSEEIISKEYIKKYYLKIAQQYDVTKKSQDNVKLYLHELLSL